jgi:hypothetical protein
MIIGHYTERIYVKAVRIFRFEDADHPHLAAGPEILQLFTHQWRVHFYQDVAISGGSELKQELEHCWLVVNLYCATRNPYIVHWRFPLLLVLLNQVRARCFVCALRLSESLNAVKARAIDAAYFLFRGGIHRDRTILRHYRFPFSVHAEQLVQRVVKPLVPTSGRLVLSPPFRFLFFLFVRVAFSA